MKLKNLLIGSTIVCAIGTTAHSLYIYKKAKAFEATLDTSDDSMDEMVLFGGKEKSYRQKHMRDMRIGAFCGGMEIDLSDVITDQTEYKMDIEIKNGGLNIIIPDNFKLNLIDRCAFGGIADETICNDPDNSIELSVHADVLFGGLQFENLEREDEKEE